MRRDGLCETLVHTDEWHRHDLAGFPVESERFPAAVGAEQK